MKNQIYISRGTGKECIFYLPGFFPCTQARLKKFVNLMMEDYENRDENINTCVDYLNNATGALIDEIVKLSELFASLKTEKASLEERIKTKKHANGVTLKREEIKEMKSTLKAINRTLKDLGEELNSCAVVKNKLEKNLETLKKLCDVD